MRKREQGILTVEASIVMTLMTLFVLFLFSFIRIYRAENIVSHATLQAADAMALESYLRENAMDDQADDVVYLANRLTGSTTLSAASFESLRSANIPTLAKEKFIAAVSNSESNADAILKIYGVKDGLSGIDFSSSTMDLDNDDVIVSVSYTLKMQFPIFGGTELSVTKTAKAKTFGEILFEIIAEPEDLNMGSVSGSGNYQHGSTIQITANPNYGYKFVKWDDGNTDNPRVVPVTEAHKYIAIFEADSFGITTVVAPADAGSATGAGTYTYLSTANLDATANPGYHFEKWSVYKHKDSTTAFVTTPDVSQTVDQSYTYTANFVPNTYTIKVATSGATGTVTVKSGASSGESVNVTYGSSFDLIQTPPTGYVFNGWKVEGGTSYISPTSGISVPDKYPNGSVIPNNATITYTAYYEIAKYNVNVSSAGNGSVSGGDTYNHGSNATIVATPNSGYEFDYWEMNGVKVNIGSSYTFTVTSAASYKAHFRKMVTPSISIESGEVGHHTVQLKAITVPADAAVTWTIHNNAVKATIDPNDSHIVTLTIDDSFIENSDLSIEKTKTNSIGAGKSGNIETQVWYDYFETKVTASINYNGVDKSASKTIRSRESVDIGYVEYWKCTKSGTKKCGGCTKKERMYYKNQISNAIDANGGIYHYVTGCYDRTWSVTYSEYLAMVSNKNKQLEKGESDASKFAKNTDGQKMNGKNMVSESGYIVQCPMGKRYEVLSFYKAVHGDKKPDGTYYNFYIYSVS